MCGAGLVRVMTPALFDKVDGGANEISKNANATESLGVEFGCTFLLVMTVMAATDSIRAETNKHISTVAPLVIGLAVTVSHFTAIPVDNCSINPARSFGVAAISGNWNDHWVFWFGPYLGATAAALCYTYLFQVSLSFSIRRFMFPYFYQVLMLTDLIEKIKKKITNPLTPSLLLFYFLTLFLQLFFPLL